MTFLSVSCGSVGKLVHWSGSFQSSSCMQNATRAIGLRILFAAGKKRTFYKWEFFSARQVLNNWGVKRRHVQVWSQHRGECGWIGKKKTVAAFRARRRGKDVLDGRLLLTASAASVATKEGILILQVGGGTTGQSVGWGVRWARVGGGGDGAMLQVDITITPTIDVCIFIHWYFAPLLQ